MLWKTRGGVLALYCTAGTLLFGGCASRPATPPAVAAVDTPPADVGGVEFFPAQGTQRSFQ